MAQLLYLNQFFLTTLNVGGGIDSSQTTGIIVSDVSGVDTTKPGIALINYADPLVTTICEWVEYTSINGSKELVGVTRGSEGYSAKTHSNGVQVAFPLSESHINRLADMFDTSGLNLKQISTPSSPSSGANKLYFKSDGTLYKLNSSGVESSVETTASTSVWTLSSDTWTYASATSFTISGVDRTSTLTKGTKIRLKQGGGYKYFYITSSSFSTNTTVNITGGTDYTFTNAAVTDNYYSYAANPDGFPAPLAYTTTQGGFSSSSGSGRFWLQGTLCFVHISVSGTSNGTSFTTTLPIAFGGLSGLVNGGFRMFDNSTAITATVTAMALTSSSTTVTLYKDWGGTLWTASGTKSADLGFFYQI